MPADPTQGGIAFDEGRRLFQAGDYRGALAALKKGLLATEDASFLLHIAQCHRFLMEPKESVMMYRTRATSLSDAANKATAYNQADYGLPSTMSSPDGGLLGSGGRVTRGGGQGGAHPIVSGRRAGGYGYPGDAGVPYPGALIAKGSSKLIAMFVGDAGIYVVTIDATMLLGRNGRVAASVVSPRSITSAAFDGTQLIVADEASRRPRISTSIP